MIHVPKFIRRASGLYAPGPLYVKQPWMMSARGIMCKCCGEPECFGRCQGGTVPSGEVQITLAGIVNDGCSNCNNYNGTFVLSYGPLHCGYVYAFPNLFCDYDEPMHTDMLSCGFGYSPGVGTGFQVLLYTGGGFWHLRWYLEMDDESPVNCTSLLNNVSVPPFPKNMNYTEACDHSSSTCMATAL